MIMNLEAEVMEEVISEVAAQEVNSEIKGYYYYKVLNTIYKLLL
jgi:hypothetical protein